MFMKSELLDWHWGSATGHHQLVRAYGGLVVRQQQIVDENGSGDGNVVIWCDNSSK